MLKRCALVIDGEGAFAESLRGWLGAHGLAVEVCAEWSQELHGELDPAIIFVAVDLPEKTGFAHCRRVRERAPAVPLILTTATIPPDELELNRQAESAGACLDKRTLTREEVMAQVVALLGPLPVRSDSSATTPEVGGRDATRRAPRGGDLLRLSAIVASKEKEIARLKKEVTARERELFTGRKTLREALSQASAAKREREQVAGHFGQLNKDLEDGQAEVTRLRVEVQRHATEAEQAIADLRREHDESLRALRQHFDDQLTALQATQEQEREKGISALESALSRVTEELASARAQAAQQERQLVEAHERERADLELRHAEAATALEARMRGEREQALAAAAADWEGRLEGLRREYASSLETLRQEHADRLEALSSVMERGRARREEEHGAARLHDAEELSAASTRAAQLEHEALQRHETELARVEAGHAEAQADLEARLNRERDGAVAATVTAWEARLEDRRLEHERRIAALRAAHGQKLGDTDTEHQAALARVSGELASLRADGDQQREKLRQRHERALGEVRAARAAAEKQIEETHRSERLALESRVREERATAVAATVAEWEGKLEKLRRGHAAALEALRRESQSFHEDQQTAAAKQLAERDAEHQAALQRAGEALAVARTEAARLDQQTREGYERERARVESEHRETLAGLESRLRSEQAQKATATVTAWELKLEELRRGHAASLEGLRREHEKQTASLQALGEKQLAAREAEHEAELRLLREELAVARGQVAQFEAAPVLSQQQHAEALEEQESRLRVEHEAAIGAVVAEWKTKMDRLRRGHADTVAALRQEHQDQLDAVQAALQRSAAEAQPDQGSDAIAPDNEEKRG